MKRGRRAQANEPTETPPQRARVDGEAPRGRGHAVVTAARATYFATGSTAPISAPVEVAPSSAEEWPGMFNTAYSLDRGRSAAQAQRQEEIEKRAAAAAEDLALWEPKTPTRSLVRVQAMVVPSLVDLTCKVIARSIHSFQQQYSEYMGERSLQLSRAKIATLVAQDRKLDASVLPFFIYPGVMEIDIPDCSMLDEMSFVSALQACQKIEKEEQIETRFSILKLGICGRCISDRVLDNLKVALSTVEEIRLDGCYRLSDDGVAFLKATCSDALESFELSSNQRISRASIESISGWSNLHTLSLSECPQFEDADFGPLAGLTQLRKLTLIQLDKASDGLLEMLFGDKSNLATLEELSLARCAQLTDAGLAHVIAKCPKLVHLDVTDVVLLTDVTFAAVRSHGLTLRRVFLRRCMLVTDAGITDLALSANQHLEVLDISSVSELTGAALTALATHCASGLRELDVSFCRYIRDADLGLLTDVCKELSVLRLYGCTQISRRFLQGHRRDELMCAGHPLLTGLKLVA
ncbi:hypothetical protein SDRG_12933 [Saprolegnia diclina VS20]|uniref:F-box/LRR-repeat protein 15-like leucin rich repeat domain-containing protein n=1 Tax=Saprolegnia diclina (strain VS20) TaxID=1156394 RepID=T0Q712_SAPDV|nr:hypothetical protein SDRG_12933 [Saprolegnia diclina VS20]EQC29265.1 hypothetical protein SDRG_12933 [Saprolegnia diclina VS20]|eukprot:XP_008617239.1 hypothetical protein SDRG_12933 [Saprolegnia diclina VS20]